MQKFRMPKETLTISSRGQITLPASMRKRLSLETNAVLTAEVIDGRVVLTPAVVLELEAYDDKQIKKWDQADEFAPGERAALEAKLAPGQA